MKENAISLGLDSKTSSWIFSCFGVGGFIGRIAGGHICDVVRAKSDDRKVVYVLIVGKLFASIGNNILDKLIIYIYIKLTPLETILHFAGRKDQIVDLTFNLNQDVLPSPHH